MIETGGGGFVAHLSTKWAVRDSPDGVAYASLWVVRQRQAESAARQMVECLVGVDHAGEPVQDVDVLLAGMGYVRVGEFGPCDCGSVVDVRPLVGVGA